MPGVGDTALTQPLNLVFIRADLKQHICSEAEEFGPN